MLDMSYKIVKFVIDLLKRMVLCLKVRRLAI